MPNHTDPKAVTVSVKIYEKMLAAYPAAFRDEYGSEMKQVFHDQCRDAWRQSSSWGLFIVWLRVVPDWGMSSVVQNLTAWKQRTAFVRRLTVVLVVLFLGSALADYLSPMVYSSHTKILVNKKSSDGDPFSAETEFLTNKQPAGWDPYFLKVQARVITSWSVLCPVITNLNLEQVLAGQVQQRDWPLDKAYLALREAVVVGQVGQPANIVNIRVSNKDPNLAAKIANAITQSYMENPILVTPSRGGNNLILGAVTIETAKPDPASGVRSEPAFLVMRAAGLALLALVVGGLFVRMLPMLPRLSHRSHPSS